MSTTIIGFPRLGEFRELKFTTEKYFRNEITADELLAAAKDLRAKHWNIVKEKVLLKFLQMTFLITITSLMRPSFST
jgi:met_syn_B12ind: 5-methyltetrahydropteroyltriglutamate--homocysteine S-methyltransferase